MRWLLLIGILLLSGCDLLPKTEFTIQHSIGGLSEYKNKIGVTRSAYSLSVPLFEINETLRVAATLQTAKSDTGRYAVEGMNKRESFAGVELVDEYWKAGLSANKNYYKADLSGNIPFADTNISLLGGITHQNAMELEPGERRFKKTAVFAGIEYKLDCHSRYSLAYHAGNHGSDDVNDALMFGVRYFFRCD